MVNALTVVGLVMILTGGFIISPYSPQLSVLNTISFGTPNINCSNSNACTAVVPITSNNATISANIWFSVKNSLGQTIDVVDQQIAAGASNIQVTQSLGTLATGQYTATIFATSPAGVALSQTVTYPFNTSFYTVSIVSPGCGTLTPTAGTYQDAIGTSVNLNFVGSSPNCIFGSWFIEPNGNINQAIQPTLDPYTLVVNNNYLVSVSLQADPTQFYETVYASDALGQSNWGTVNPASAQVFSSSAGGPISATFTASPNTGFAFQNWQLLETGTTYTTPQTTLTYSQLFAVFQQTGIHFHLQAQFVRTTAWLDIGAVTGASTNPAAGNHTYTSGQVVPVSISVQTGYCFNGWALDGNDLAATTPLSVTMNQNHFLQPEVLPNGSSGCTTPPGGGSNNLWIGGATALIGVVLVALGNRKKI